MSCRLSSAFKAAPPLQWHISCNLLILRLISYGMDLHWARLHDKQAACPASAASDLKASLCPLYLHHAAVNPLELSRCLCCEPATSWQRRQLT